MSFMYGNFQDIMFGPGSASRPNPVQNQGATIGGDLEYYGQLGQQLLQQQQQMASMQAQQQPQQMVAPQGGSIGAGAGPITVGFNNDWLTERLAAGSANGAKIGGLSSPQESSPIPESSDAADDMQAGGPEAGWKTKTMKSWPKSASRIQNGGGGFSAMMGR